MRIEPIADHPELFDVVARWHWDEWGESDQHGSLQQWCDGLRARARVGGIPTTFVAFHGEQPVGSVTLTEHDMPGHLGYEDFGPWIAGTYVEESARSSGVGTALMRHAVERASEWGVERLYLYTEAARGFYERLGWTTLDETEYEGGRVAVMTLDTGLPFPAHVPATRRLSQCISEGDGIAVIACVDDVAAARAAEEDGAKALAIRAPVAGIREATTLPLLWIGTGGPADADAYALRPGADSEHDQLELVVDVRDEDELELALESLDPEIFLLAAGEDGELDPIDAVLELLPDVPAGKLAIALVDVASRDEVLALERAGIDAVLVGGGNVAELVGQRPFEV